jgi:hypothetical protein
MKTKLYKMYAGVQNIVYAGKPMTIPKVIPILFPFPHLEIKYSAIHNVFGLLGV